MKKIKNMSYSLALQTSNENPNDYNIWKPFGDTNPNSWNSHKLYDFSWDDRTQELLPNFQGLGWRLAIDWFDFIHYSSDLKRTTPIEYLEIGTLHGANLLSVNMTYAAHPQSHLTIIDPYKDYSEYGEYQGEQQLNLQTLCNNLNYFKVPKSKVSLHRNLSHLVLPTLQENYYDLIYIDGNHTSKSVLEDAVLSWRKLKPGGFLIFDDYDWGNSEQSGGCPKDAVRCFVYAYSHEISLHKEMHGQYLVMKQGDAGALQLRQERQE